MKSFRCLILLTSLLICTAARGQKMRFDAPVPRAHLRILDRPTVRPDSTAKPVYPETALSQRAGAFVWLRLKIGRNGKVIEKSVESCTTPNLGFEEEAMRIASTSRLLLKSSGTAHRGECYMPMTFSCPEAKDSASSLVDTAQYSTVSVPPVMKKEAKPTYPREAKAKGAEGSCRVLALVDTAGVVEAAMIDCSALSPELDRAALRAAFKCRYQPGMMGGKAVPCWVSYEVRFELYR